MSKEPREYFEGKCEAQLRSFKEELGELEFKVENTGWEPETDNLREIAELRLKLDGVATKFQELKTASDSSWQAHRQDMENALDEFGSSLKAAVSKWEAFLPD
jgi:hypothetical protein